MVRLKLMRFALFLLLLCGLFPLSACDDEKPESRYSTEITNYINDYADVLSPETEEELNQLGKQFEEQTGGQFVVLIEPDLNGEEIHDLANTIFNEVGLGAKEKNNGLLLLVDMDEHEYWLEVGDGLEGTLTDIGAHRLLETYLKPGFKDDDYDRGVTDFYTHTLSFLEGSEELPEEEDDSWVFWLVGGIIALGAGILAIVFGSLARMGVYLQPGESLSVKVKGYDPERGDILESNHPDIVCVNGSVITALQKGKAKITIKKWRKKKQKYKEQGTFPVFVGRKRRQNDDVNLARIAMYMSMMDSNSSHHSSGGFSSGGFSGGGGISSGGGAGGSW